MGCHSGEREKREFNIFVEKKPDYNIMVISSFLGLTVPERQKAYRRIVNG